VEVEEAMPNGVVMGGATSEAAESTLLWFPSSQFFPPRTFTSFASSTRLSFPIPLAWMDTLRRTERGGIEAGNPNETPKMQDGNLHFKKSTKETDEKRGDWGLKRIAATTMKSGVRFDSWEARIAR
jgi:hypothetical protein